MTEVASENSSRSLLIVSSDLLHSSRLRAIAEQLGWQTRIVGRTKMAAELVASETGFDRALVDLRLIDSQPTAPSDLRELARRIPMWAGFGPHVRKDLHAAALDLGAAKTFMQSQLEGGIPQWLDEA